MIATSKLVGSIDREVKAFSADLRDQASKLVAERSDAGVKFYQTPDRILLQAGDIGVTVSLFRSRAGEQASAEVVVGVWKGSVVFPGTEPVEGQRAQQVGDRTFQISSSEGDKWLWEGAHLDSAISSSTLAEVCVGEMAGLLGSHQIA